MPPITPGGCIWLTGLSGSGKTVIANALALHLPRSRILDGDEVRRGINWDLGFSKEDRDTNIRRIAYVAECIADVGGTAIVSAISPYDAAREAARWQIGPDRFYLIHVSTPLAVCEQRDAKGLYARAREGTLTHFTGISDPFEVPTGPHLTLDASAPDPQEAIEAILNYIEE